MKKVNVVVLIGFLLMLVSGEQTLAGQKDSKAAKGTSKKVSIDFSFAGVAWTDTPDIISKKIGQTEKFKYDYLDEIGSTQDLLTFNDDYLHKIFELCETRGKSNITQYRWSAGLNTGDDQIDFKFSDETQKLLFYVFSGKKVNKLFDMLVEKYGEPSITLDKWKEKGDVKDADGLIIPKKALASYKWVGIGQSLYYGGFMTDAILYINTVTLEEHAAIVQKKIKELEQSEKNKMKGVF